jgi:hypothetical protein
MNPPNCPLPFPVIVTVLPQLVALVTSGSADSSARVERLGSQEVHGHPGVDALRQRRRRVQSDDP